MRCPVCYNKIKYDGNICSFCKFKVSELNSTSNKGIYTLRKRGEGDKVIYTTQIPSDLNYRKTTLLAVFLGWFGIHNYYVGKIFKGLFMSVGFTIGVVLSELLANPNTIDLAQSLFILTPVFALAMVSYIVDVVSLFTKNFKVPVALKNHLKKEK